MKYRPNVCVVIVNDLQDQVLMFHRKGADEYGWQFPQGGVDQGESDLTTMYRELEEEIGTKAVEILKISEKRIKYKFPDWVRKKLSKKRFKKYKGQKQRWFLVRLMNGIQEIHFEHEPIEFDDFKWVSPDDILEQVIPFKRKAYKKGLQALGVLNAD